MSRYQGKLFTFLGLLVLLCMYPVIRIISVGDILLASGDAMLLMWAPTIAAVLTKLIFDRSLRGFGFGLHGWPVLLAAYLLPVMGGGLVYGFAWVSGIGTLDAGLLSVFGPLQWIGLVGIPLSLLTALGEEIGWRGFLVPELARRYGYTATALISAAVWSVYHYPLVIWGGYNNGFSVPLSLLIFTVSVTGISFVTAWMRMKTGSLWGPALLHAAHNYFIQSLFDPLTIPRGNTALWTTEFGIGLALVYTVAGYVCWRMRGALPQRESAASGIQAARIP